MYHSPFFVNICRVDFPAVFSIFFPFFTGMSDEQLDHEEVDMPDVPVGALAKLIEANQTLRARVLEFNTGQLTRWPSPTTVGVKSVKAMSLNATLLEVVAEWWVQLMPVPKPPSVDLCRQEASFFKKGVVGHGNIVFKRYCSN